MLTELDKPMTIRAFEWPDETDNEDRAGYFVGLGDKITTADDFDTLA